MRAMRDGDKSGEVRDWCQDLIRSPKCHTISTSREFNANERS